MSAEHKMSVSLRSCTWCGEKFVAQSKSDSPLAVDAQAWSHGTSIRDLAISERHEDIAISVKQRHNVGRLASEIIEQAIPYCHLCTSSVEEALDNEFMSHAIESESYRLIGFQVAQQDTNNETTLDLQSAQHAIARLEELELVLASIDTQSSTLRRNALREKRSRLWRENNRLDRLRDTLLMSMEADKNLETLYQENADVLRVVRPQLDAFNINSEAQPVTINGFVFGIEEGKLTADWRPLNEAWGQAAMLMAQVIEATKFVRNAAVAMRTWNQKRVWRIWAQGPRSVMESKQINQTDTVKRARLWVDEDPTAASSSWTRLVWSTSKSEFDTAVEAFMQLVQLQLEFMAATGAPPSPFQLQGNAIFDPLHPLASKKLLTPSLSGSHAAWNSALSMLLSVLRHILLWQASSTDVKQGKQRYDK